jgi:hypothetical protein
MLAAEFETELERFQETEGFALSSSEPPTSAEQIDLFEHVHNIRLPQQYRYVATRVGAGDVGYANLFSVGAGYFSIAAQRATTPALPSDFIPVSDNGCGDFYGFVVRGGICAPEVYFADHESEYQVSKTEFSDLYEYLVRYAFNVA